jgi:hypothetical protein
MKLSQFHSAFHLKISFPFAGLPASERVENFENHLQATKSDLV